MMKISALFSNGLILQRGKKNIVWAVVDASAKVVVELSKDGAVVEKLEAAADDKGYFEVFLSEREAGGPYTLTITSGDDRHEVQDLLFGDVFLCGGQSNMELMINRVTEMFQDEVEKLNEEDVRLFNVPQYFNFHEGEDFLESGMWQKIVYPQVLNLGSLATFIGVQLKAKTGVPIGLYNTAIGGTPIKAWTSMETIEKMGLHYDELLRCRDDKKVQETIAREQKNDCDWRAEADRIFADEALVPEETGKVKVPGWLVDSGIKIGPMCIRVTRKVVLGPEWEGKAAKLYIGAIIDSDKVYVNGTYVGETGYLYPPRIYKVPEGVLHEGENLIDIHMLVFRNDGGFMPGKFYKLHSVDGNEVSIEGEWDYSILKRMPESPNTTFFNYMASGPYNHMIVPLRKQNISGVFFYQGESNICDYKTYKVEFDAAVADWRKNFNNPELPFIFVQVARFNEGGRFNEELRALFTEEQRKCIDGNLTVMAQAYDLGEYNDLHPLNKKEVARRIVMAADAVVYKNREYTPGPQLVKTEKTDKGIKLTFDEELKQIDLTKNKYSGAEIPFTAEPFFVYADKKSSPAKAEKLDGCVIELTLPDGVTSEAVEEVSYAWRDCPLDSDLLSVSDDLPIVPFRTKL